MKRVLWGALVGVGVLAGCEGLVVEEPRMPSRTMGVRAAPELAFNRPAEEVVPLLAGAEATGNNGRVGPELVFWSYRLADGRDVLLHACADIEGVDCAGRLQMICRSGTPRPVYSGNASGEVRRLECRAISQAGAGDLRPGCEDSSFENNLLVGVSACP